MFCKRFALVLLAVISANVSALPLIDKGIFSTSSNSIGLGAGTSYTHDPSNSNLTLTNVFGISGVSVDNVGYLIFDTQTIQSPVSSATLDLSFSNINLQGFGLGPHSVQLTFREFASDPVLLQNAYNECSSSFCFNDPLGIGQDLYQDLASGMTYAAASVTNGMTSLSLDLLPGALSNLNANLGNLFVMGIGMTGDFGSVTIADAELVTAVVAVAAPAATYLWFVLLGLSFWMRTRSRK